MQKTVPVLACVLGLLAAVLVSCDDAGELEYTPPRFESTLDPVLVVGFKGRQHKLPLDRFKVYLTNVMPDEKDRYPETFALRGPDVLLVGTIPGASSVGYERRFEKLVGQTLPLTTAGGENGDSEAFIRLAVEPFAVLGGTLTIEKIQPESDSLTPLKGSFEIRVKTDTGDEATMMGSFEVDGSVSG